MTSSGALPGPDTAKRILTLDGVALLLMLPMFVSAFLFATYDIAMTSLPLEILRQLNAPFVVAELVVIVVAMRRGMTIRGLVAMLDAPARAALAVFLASFWIGGAFTSQAAPFALLHNLCVPIHALFACAVMHLLAAVRDAETDRFAKLIAAALAAFAVLTAIKFAFPPPGRPIETIIWQFALPGFISVRLFGALVAPFACLFAYLALADRGAAAPPRWVHAGLALTFGLLVWSGTRAGIVGAGVTGLLAVFAFRLKVFTARLLPAIGAAFAGAAAAVFLVPYGETNFLLYTSSDLADANIATGGRLHFWTGIWRAYLEVPLFGAGPGATAWILADDQFPHIQPHNILLQFLIGWGLIATLPALYLLARITLAAHRRARAFGPAVPFVLMADCLLVISLFDGSFHFAQHLMLWAAAIGIAFAGTPRPVGHPAKDSAPTPVAAG